VKRLLLLPLLLASYALIGPSAIVLLPADPKGATLTATAGPNYTILTYLPGKAGTLNTVVHLLGPALRVNDSRCVPEPEGILRAGHRACTGAPRDLRHRLCLEHSGR